MAVILEGVGVGILVEVMCFVRVMVAVDVLSVVPVILMMPCLMSGWSGMRGVRVLVRVLVQRIRGISSAAGMCVMSSAVLSNGNQRRAFVVVAGLVVEVRMFVAFRFFVVHRFLIGYGLFVANRLWRLHCFGLHCFGLRGRLGNMHGRRLGGRDGDDGSLRGRRRNLRRVEQGFLGVSLGRNCVLSLGCQQFLPGTYFLAGQGVSGVTERIT